MFEFKKTGQQQKQRFALRAWVGGLFALACFFVLVGRFWYLQVDRYEGLSERADRNRIAVVPIAPRRGEILDRNGVVMARNYRTYTLEVVPGHAGDINAMLERLTPIVYVSPGDQRRFKRRVLESGRYASLILRNNLNDTEASWFAAHAYEFPGVELRARWVREYPQGATAGHVVGFIGRISENDVEALEAAGQLGNYRGTDVIGKKGIEKSWEEQLHGQTGIEEVEVNASGRPVRTLHRRDPVPGVDIMLSIDLGLQRVAEEAFGDQRGALVAIDPDTGEVLAFVSKPSFDPNLFIDGIDVENWRLLNESPDHPLINRPLYGTYPIGSTYKPFVALAALELGVRSAKQRISDPGYYEFGGQRFRNAGGAAYGMTDMHRAIVVSSDTYFYSLGPEIGVDRLHDFSKQFGFGQITGIDLDGERAGILPSIEWKRKAYKDRKQQQWYAGETISVAVGQGYNSFTLLQLAQATSTLANSGAYRRPHLVHATRDTRTGVATPTPSTPDYLIPLKQENVDVIKNAMVGVVRSGTARRAFAGAAYQAAGKTGTAQVFSLRGSKYKASELDERLRDHALFMGFAPADKPRIAVALLVENAGWGASVAAPVARTVFDYWLSRPATPPVGSRVVLPSGVAPLSESAPEAGTGATPEADSASVPDGAVVTGSEGVTETEPEFRWVPGSDKPPAPPRPRPVPKATPAPQAPTATRRPSTGPALSDLDDLFKASEKRVKP
ncbi:penicillin-binding protein 2 [Bordetella tumulicola]|uniref:penicillin-binding protein 2 n=1 Tax=Bordetella tumulicola TaxID=1649133 RepID=UPI0039F02DFE